LSKVSPSGRACVVIGGRGGCASRGPCPILVTEAELGPGLRPVIERCP
jgi:hypothetical protein